MLDPAGQMIFLPSMVKAMVSKGKGSFVRLVIRFAGWPVSPFAGYFNGHAG
jgi:hypothetical protein